MKTLITHINPHLDDIAAIWLFKKFHPEFVSAKIKFISQSDTYKHKGKETEDRIYLGTGMGKYDEHKGDLGTCAMSLVWDDINKIGLAPKDRFEAAAIDEIVKWNLLYDTAQMPFGDWDDFTVEAFIRSYKNSPKDSLATVNLGCQILDRILPGVIEKQKALKDWQKRAEFKSKWGKAVAVESEHVGQDLAYRNGFQISVIRNPKNHFIGICAAGTSDIDLTPVYLKVSHHDPEAGWYFHHSKKMILCGAKSAPDVKRSKLTLKEVIDIIRTC